MGMIGMNQEKKKLLKIGELAKRAGVTVRTIRYYEELGLLSPTEVSPGGFRLYTENDLYRFQFIQRFKDLGLPLEEIHALIDSSEPGESKMQRIMASYSLFEKQLKKIEDKISELEVSKANIEKGMEALNVCKECSREICLPTCSNKKSLL
ncbi:Regulatory protein, MerR [Desulfosporosinus metallidurans]|uniref:Regulatory protein, MerR n=2 Tax=Desulfosporosinus metallidurans TaxID=1888891 RepID=A0A1Q8QMZ6_9FIRM|nr:Regulatory protein, MerR [Desulfosporosinus metallidurans]